MFDKKKFILDRYFESNKTYERLIKQPNHQDITRGVLPPSGNPKCYYCKKHLTREETAVISTYRRDCKTVSCKACENKENHYKNEQIRTLQWLDQSCNECVFFQRFKGQKWFCKKLNKDVLAQQWVALGNHCKGEHRKHRNPEAQKVIDERNKAVANATKTTTNK